MEKKELIAIGGIVLAVILGLLVVNVVLPGIAQKKDNT